VQRGQYASPNRPFVSPIVLATYREYAETLRAARVATPQATPGFDQPYFYDLDIGGFLNLGRAGNSWDDLNIGAHGFTNGNTVLAQTTDMCTSNSSATYLGLVSYLTRNGLPTTERDPATSLPRSSRCCVARDCPRARRKISTSSRRDERSRRSS